MFRRQVLRTTREVSQRLTQSPRTQYIASSQFSSLSSQSARLSQSTLSQAFSRRWQSTEAQQSADKPAEGTANPTEPSADAALKQEIEKKNKEVIDLKDKYLRSVADYRNLQDRSQREQTNARQYAIQKFAVDLLDSIDNLDRALSAVPEAALGKAPSSTTSNTSSSDPNVAAASESVAEPNKDLVSLHGGLRMTEQILMQTLKKHGLERYDPLERDGAKFDPNLDEATFFTKVEGKNDGQVFYTQSKGYTLNGRVIKASKVGVVKNS